MKTKSQANLKINISRLKTSSPILVANLSSPLSIWQKIAASILRDPCMPKITRKLKSSLSGSRGYLRTDRTRAESKIKIVFLKRTCRSSSTTIISKTWTLYSKTAEASTWTKTACQGNKIITTLKTLRKMKFSTTILAYTTITSNRWG